MQCDIKLDEFFEYTLKELKIVIKAYNEKQRNELRIQSQMNYVSNSSLASMISCLFSKNAHMPKYEDLYSFLYDAKELSDIEEKKQEAKRQAEIKRIQANLMAMAHSFNAKFDKENKPDE